MQTKANTGNRITYIKKEQKSIEEENKGKSIENTRNKVAKYSHDSQMTWKRFLRLDRFRIKLIENGRDF